MRTGTSKVTEEKTGNLSIGVSTETGSIRETKFIRSDSMVAPSVGKIEMGLMGFKVGVGRMEQRKKDLLKSERLFYVLILLNKHVKDIPSRKKDFSSNTRR